MVIAKIAILYDNRLSKIAAFSVLSTICVSDTHLAIILLILVVRKQNAVFFSRIGVFFYF
jgi:hypothetical protein